MNCMEEKLSADNKVCKHPVISKCMQHLDIISADDKTKQLVYMYMECLRKDLTAKNQMNMD